MENRLSITKFIIIMIALYIILYVVLKLFIVFTQDLYMKNEVTDKTYGIGSVLQITSYTEEEKANTTYFESTSSDLSIKVKDYFQGFEEGDKDNNYEYHMLYEEDNTIKAVFMMGKFKSQIYNINDFNEDNYYYEFNHFPLYISKLAKEYYIKKNNIKNDVDLIKYIRSRKKEDCNFFTPIIKIKENYFFNFVETSLPSLDSVTYLEGDIEGYIYEATNFKQACILKEDDLYCLTFFKLDYFNDDIIKDVLRSVIIEE